VITRRHAEIRMTPAVCSGAAFGCAIAIIVCLTSGISLAVSPGWQLPLLTLFGVSMGLGMALFTQGARLIPSAFAALISTAEVILGPIWVGIFLDEVPGLRTSVGGAIVLTAILAYLAWQIIDNRKLRRIAPQVH
jgi:drug/metabolite transporter (DMT)-like permease